jgi:hypothetical protein
MNIGWFCWEPELTGTEKTSGGGAAWTNKLFRHFINEGHHIVWLAESSPPPLTNVGIQPDVAVFCWRWEMLAHPERQRAYMRQWELIHKYSGLNVPMLVHDQDHKISRHDYQDLISAGVVLSAPELNPRPGFRRLMFPNPYGFVANPRRHRTPFAAPSWLMYVGNNYERFDQAVNFIGPTSEYYGADLYGNWLEESPLRESPEVVKASLPHVTFHGRVSQQEVPELLERANYTVHLFKESYGPCGFTTIRWAEAVSAATPAFIPADFWLPSDAKAAMKGMVVKDGKDMLDRIRHIDEETWYQQIEAQQTFVNFYFRAQAWTELLNEIAK